MFSKARLKQLKYFVSNLYVLGIYVYIIIKRNLTVFTDNYHISITGINVPFSITNFITNF